MDGRSVARAVGTLVRWFSLTLVIPVVVAIGYGEPTLPFLVPLVGGTALGLALERLRGSARVVGVREGFAVVALGWLVVAGIASVPYILDGGDASRPVDAFFEGMSGITATGSSILIDIPGHDRALLFWRALTQWIGGMGIVVLAIAILPGISMGGRGLAERETSGHDYQKLLPRARSSAARLWLLYVALSGAAFLAFWLLGLTGIEPRMDLYDAVTTAMTTVAAGGFSTEARSFEAFGAAAQWVAIVFMSLVGVSFVLWYRALFRSHRALLRDEELRLYVTLLARRRLAARDHPLCRGAVRRRRQHPPRAVPVGLGDHRHRLRLGRLRRMVERRPGGAADADVRRRLRGIGGRRPQDRPRAAGRPARRAARCA